MIASFRLAALGVASLALSLAAAAAPLNLAPSAATTKPLGVGALVPDLTLRIAGGDFDLGHALGEKTTVLIFFRGGWCPYCSQQMGELAKLEPQLLKLGVQIIAISTDRPVRLQAVADANGAHYRLLSDRLMRASSAFGLAYRIDPPMQKKYAEWGIDVPPIPDDESDGRWLPVPAAFVIGRDHRVKFSFSDPDYTIRISSDRLLRAVMAAQP
jgi:peroxiredoxin